LVSSGFSTQETRKNRKKPEKTRKRRNMETHHQENMRVIFGVFVSGNRIFERFVFVKAVFQDLCLWIQIFGI
jgi:Tfp pilus assembly protein PilP